MLEVRDYTVLCAEALLDWIKLQQRALRREVTCFPEPLSIENRMVQMYAERLALALEGDKHNNVKTETWREP